MALVANSVSDADKLLTSFENDLNNANDGIDPLLVQMKNLLVKKDDYHNPGLIFLVCDKLSEELIDRNKPLSDMGWYLKALSQYLAVQIQWQTVASALKLFTLRNGKRRCHIDL